MVTAIQHCWTSQQWHTTLLTNFSRRAKKVSSRAQALPGREGMSSGILFDLVPKLCLGTQLRLIAYLALIPREDGALQRHNAFHHRRGKRAGVRRRYCFSKLCSVLCAGHYGAHSGKAQGVAHSRR